MIQERPPAIAEPSLATALSEARRAPRLRLLLDYDGTLVPLAGSPELAAPDEELLSLLAELAALPGVDVDIVSGRPRQTLEEWLGSVPLSLWAEHGFWYRPSPDAAWHAATTAGLDWMNRLRPILEQFTDSTPGSLIEVKSASMAWHYRGAGQEFGSRQAHELRLLLDHAFSNQPVEVLDGHKVIEVRLQGVSKALAADQIERSAILDTAVIAIGDDRTDEDLFRALPGSAVTIAVGRRPTCARFRVEDDRAVRVLLRRLLATKPSPLGDGRGGYPLAVASTA
ncbi:MAG: trehalose-phosphatase [Acidobacteriota bacterium]